MHEEKICEENNLQESIDGETITDSCENSDCLNGCEETENDIQKQLEEKTKKCDEYFEMLQRTAAEFDNFRKRTAKERESFFSDTVKDIVSAMLPVLDNLERAVQSAENETHSIKEGVSLVLRQFKDVLKGFGVEEIKAEGENFDPEIHSAVMHIEDENYGTNVIVEELQRGYKIGDKVIRYSLVKVAN